jgi:hypothetical protein
LTALLARFISSSVAHDDPDSSGGIPSAIQQARHSPTATVSRSGSAKVSMMGSTPLKAEIVPPRFSALSSTRRAPGVIGFPELR